MRTLKQKEEELKADLVRADMWAYLKTLSKRELIRTVLEHLNLYMLECQKTKELEAKLNNQTPIESKETT